MSNILKSLVLIVIMFLYPSFVFGESVNLDFLNQVQLTDAAATSTRIVKTNQIKDLTVDVIIDKGGTLVITPILADNDDTILGEASTTTTIAAGGDTIRVIYSNISAPKAKVVFTKTEAGASTTFTMTIRGIK